jgi:hypothetical protein
VDVHALGAEDELLQAGFLSIFWRDHDPERIIHNIAAIVNRRANFLLAKTSFLVIVTLRI